MNRQHRKPTAAWIERRMRQGEVLDAAAKRLSANDIPGATEVCRQGLILRPEDIRFPVPRVTVGATASSKVKAATIPERIAVAYRDGFIDRYSPERWRLVNPGAMRIINLQVGDHAFPTVISRGTVRSPSSSATVWWDCWPTVDHRTARAREGNAEADNLICASWWRNASKGALNTEQTGWEVQEPGDTQDWDGLSSWLVQAVEAEPELLDDPIVRTYHKATAPKISH